MKKLVCLIWLFPFLWSVNLSAQCTPDPNCIDVLAPGQICPSPLPDAVINSFYYQVVTILPPGTALVGGIPITLVKIKLGAIKNLPPGITYLQEKTTMYPDRKYCGVMSGTPTLAGLYKLEIEVTPYILIGQDTTSLQPIKDDTSMVIKVVLSSDLGFPSGDTPFAGPYPNPFTAEAIFEYRASRPGQVDLRVFSLNGQLVYHERRMARAGMNRIPVPGKNLRPGIYYSKLNTAEGAYIRKIVRQ